MQKALGIEFHNQGHMFVMRVTQSREKKKRKTGNAYW